jgi:hypothetical protein
MTSRWLLPTGESLGGWPAIERSAQRPCEGTVYANHYHFLFRFKGDKVRRIYTYMDTTTATEVLVPLVWGERRDFQDPN